MEVCIHTGTCILRLLLCLLSVAGFTCSSAPAVAADPVGQPGLLCQQVVLAGSGSTSSSGSSSSRPAIVHLDPAIYGYQGCYCTAPLAAVTQQQDGRTVRMACGAKEVCDNATWCKSSAGMNAARQIQQQLAQSVPQHMPCNLHVQNQGGLCMVCGSRAGQTA